MKTRYYLFSFTLLLLFVCLGSINVLYANGNSSITFEMVETDRSKLPKGPNPTNYTAYDPLTAETFSFRLTGFSDNEYYTLSASLTRSDYAGYAANFGDNMYKDLTFLKSDYVQTTTVNGEDVTTYPLGWEWESDTSLSFEIDTTTNEKPGNIVVRCHDWGANGTLTVTIRKRQARIHG